MKDERQRRGFVLDMLKGPMSVWVGADVTNAVSSPDVRLIIRLRIYIILIFLCCRCCCCRWWWCCVSGVDVDVDVDVVVVVVGVVFVAALYLLMF